MTVTNQLTLFLAWSNGEAARYIQLFKSFERKPPDLIKERADQSYLAQLSGVLTTINGLNKTDVLTLASSFGVSSCFVMLPKSTYRITLYALIFFSVAQSFRNITEASPSELLKCAGLGEKKVNRLIDSFNSPFGPPNQSQPTNPIAQPVQVHEQEPEILDADVEFEL